MAQEGVKKKRPPPPPRTLERGEMAVAVNPMEQQPITPEALGVGQQQDQRLEIALLQQAEDGSSMSAGHTLPTGPCSPHSRGSRWQHGGRSRHWRAEQVEAHGLPLSLMHQEEGNSGDRRHGKEEVGPKNVKASVPILAGGGPGRDYPHWMHATAVPGLKLHTGTGSGADLRTLGNPKHLYSSPEETMEDLKVPLIDAPVVALHLGAVLPKDRENALKDAMNRKNEATLKKAHEAMSLAIRSTATLSNFTRATAIWADNLLQNLEVSLLVLRRTLLKMKSAVEFTADASQDNIQFCTRAQAANIITCRNIWLKH
ncbi:UNVERIFIED_CONTAM: hypothetical protein K2H54_056241 [Gekko kuhli]